MKKNQNKLNNSNDDALRYRSKGESGLQKEEYCNFQIIGPVVEKSFQNVIQDAENIQITSWSLNLFDRWGNSVFRTLDPNIAWDGKWMNNQLKPGVYVYNLQVEYIDDTGPGKENTSGTITLLE